MYLHYATANETDQAWRPTGDSEGQAVLAAFIIRAIKELTVGNAWVSLGYSNDLFQAQQDALKPKRPFKLNFQPATRRQHHVDG